MDASPGLLNGSKGSQGVTKSVQEHVTEAQLAEKPVVLATPGEGSSRAAQSFSPSSEVVVSSVSIVERGVQETPVKKAELSSSPLGSVSLVSSLSSSSSSSSSSSFSSFSSSSGLSASISSSAVLGGEMLMQSSVEQSETELRKKRETTRFLKEITQNLRSKSFERYEHFFQTFIKQDRGLEKNTVSVIAACRFVYELSCMSNKVLRNTLDIREYLKEVTVDVPNHKHIQELFNPSESSKLNRVFNIISSVAILRVAKISQRHISLEMFLSAQGIDHSRGLSCIFLLQSLLLLNDRSVLEGEGGIYQVFDALYRDREKLQITNFKRIRNFILSILAGAGEDPEKIRAISDRMTKSWHLVVKSENSDTVKKALLFGRGVVIILIRAGAQTFTAFTNIRTKDFQDQSIARLPSDKTIKKAADTLVNKNGFKDMTIGMIIGAIIYKFGPFWPFSWLSIVFGMMIGYMYADSQKNTGLRRV